MVYYVIISIKKIGGVSLKKTIAMLLILTIIFSTATIVLADNVSSNPISVLLNGTTLSFDVPPQIINDRVMVPIRAIFEALGADVYWIDSEQMVLGVKNETKILMAIDQKELIKFIGNDFDKFIGFLDDAQPITLDVPPKLIDGRTLVPLRAVSEALGVNVEWNEENNIVQLACSDDFKSNINTDKEFEPKLVDYINGLQDSEEHELFNESDDVQKVIVESNDSTNHEVYMLDSKKDVETLKNCFSKVSDHMGEGAEEKYRINFINDFTLHGIPFPDLFSQNQISTVNSFTKDENKKYQYTFQVKNSIDFQSLKKNIIDNGNIAYLPYSSMTGTKPSITLSYIAVAKDEKEWHDAFFNDNKLGEFEYDNYFIPFINELKEKGLYFDNSTCSFSSGGSLYFSREIEIYLTRSLTEDEITKIKDKAKSSYIIGAPQRFMPVTYFLYNELEVYEVKVIFDSEQSNEEIKAFCQKYNIDSFDYDKKLLDFDDITIYSFRNTVSPDKLNPPVRMSLSVSKNLELTVKEYEPNAFIPFKDADPKFTIIEQRKITDKDYQEIKRILSNYDIFQITDNLGFGGYAFDKFVYIGLKTGEKLYVCGGQDPYSNNERFYNIYSRIVKTLNIDF